MSATVWDIDGIRKAIGEARQAAEAEMARDRNDGGSANLDFVYLAAAGMRSGVSRKINGGEPFKAGWHGRVLKIYSGHGQADLNARMCQVFLKKFREFGYDAGIYYQLD